ncbi:MAG: segregation/condensation protein A [Patescibacteria group bacterium]
MTSEFKLKVGEFEGPLPLLLDLIEKRKLHISEVSLALVADSYVSYLNGLGEQKSMSEMANFIVVAATLMLIKSISLLPNIQVTEEERASIEDLENRLKIYQKIKNLSVHVKKSFGNKTIMYREGRGEVTPVFSPTKSVNLLNFNQIIRNLIATLPSVEKIPQVIVKKILSLEEVMQDLAKRVQSAFKMNFGQFVADKKDKINIIVSFLGMLELVKQGIVEVRQDSHFADISIENLNSTSVPHY